jgi:hypothetical protein
VEAAGARAVGVLGEGQEALLGGVGIRAVLIEALEHPVHQPDQILVRPAGGEPGEHRTEFGDGAAPLGDQVRLPRCGDLADQVDVVGGQRTGGVPLPHRRQLLQRPAVADHLRGRGAGEPAVSAQP